VLLLAVVPPSRAAAQENSGAAEDADGRVQSSPAAESDAKARARALVREAFEHVYEGEHALALDKFERAYELFPSPKILLNIGTTYKKLGRYAESADAYERYLRDPDMDSAREGEVRRELAEAEAHVAQLRIEVNVEGARVLVDGHLVTLAAGGTVRVDPGAHSVVAEKEGYEPRTVTVFAVKAKETRVVRLGLVSYQQQLQAQARAQAQAFESGQAAAMSVIERRRVETGRRVGGIVGVAIAVQEPATSAIVGLTYGVTERIDVEATAIVGGDVGVYAGGRFFFNLDRVRLSASGGLPMFFIDGANPGVRGAVGGSFFAGDHFAATVDIGVEHYFSLPGSLRATLFVPRISLDARL